LRIFLINSIGVTLAKHTDLTLYIQAFQEYLELRQPLTSKALDI
jgi:hypothetical protein